MGWIRRRGWVVVLIHVVGVVGVAGTFVRFFRPRWLPDDVGWRGLWETFAPELVLIWLTVVAIDRLVDARRDALDRRASVRGTLNYIGRLVRDVAPRYAGWNIKDLADECRWARELVLPRTRQYLTADERRRFSEALGIADDVLARSLRSSALLIEVEDREQQVGWAFDEATRGRGSHPYRSDLRSLDQVRIAFRRTCDLLPSTTSAGVDFSGTLEQCETELSSIQLAPNVADAIAKYLTAMRTYVASGVELAERVRDYLDLVHQIEYKLIDHEVPPSTEAETPRA